MNLDINEFAPAPIPFPNPTIIMNIGDTNPTAAKGPAPSPDTHILSTTLFNDINSILKIIGKASLFIAFFGSPVIDFKFDVTFIFTPFLSHETLSHESVYN